MKLPSIIRTPKHQRFHFEPRYYDPVKEEFREREERIKRSLSLKDVEGYDEEDYAQHSAIRGSFIQKRSAKSGSAGLMQFIIAVLLIGLIFGYMFYGDLAVYIVLAISSVLLYFKLVKRR